MFFRPVDIQLQKLAQFYQISPVFPMENNVCLGCSAGLSAKGIFIPKTNLTVGSIVYGV